MVLQPSNFTFIVPRSLKKLPTASSRFCQGPGFFIAAIMDRRSWDSLAFLGLFTIQTGPTPTNNRQQTMLDACIQNFFPVSTLYRVAGWGVGGGGGRSARKFRKGCTLVRGNRDMTEKYEYCSTVPRTFFQDFGLRQPRVNVNFQFRYESFKCRFTLIVFVYNLLMEFSKNNRGNYVRKCF